MCPSGFPGNTKFWADRDKDLDAKISNQWSCWAEKVRERSIRNVEGKYESFLYLDWGGS